MAAPPAALTVEITHGSGAEAGSVRIAAEGELDVGSAARLLEAVDQAACAGDAGELILDLSRLRFIDSTGMRALIEIEQGAGARRASLVVVPPPADITQLLEVAGVAARLRLADEGPPLPAELDFLERADLELSANRQAPGAARATVRELLEGAVEKATLSATVLMTSELVTNAVMHPAVGEPSTVGLRIVVFPDRVRVEVDDPGRGFDPGRHLPQEGPIPGPGEGGRGLFVVDRTAARWGSRQHQTDRGRRFSVWFEVETT
jgi:anti-sigma B factor antagonist